jgi:hypothetical protein
MGLFHIKSWSTACADLVAHLLQLPALSEADRCVLQSCAAQQANIHRQANLLVYFPDVANEYNEDKDLADLGVRAKKLRKLSSKDINAANFITGPVAHVPVTAVAPTAISAAAAASTVPTQITAPQQRYSQTGSFRAGSCPYHPLSTTHDQSTCREARRKTGGGGGASGNSKAKSNND